MAGYLLDTNALSEPTRRHPARSVVAWLASADEDSLFVSVVSLGELRKGIELIDDRRRRSRLEVWLEHELPKRFASRILSIDRSIVDRWGRLAAAAKSQPLADIDALLAATASVHELTIVSRNVRDFVRTGVPVLDLWSGE